MKKIKVYGELKKFLGQGTFYFDVSTPSQALKALFVNFKGLEKWILDNDKNGVVYKVKVGTEEIGEENIADLAIPLGTKEVFSIAPIITGAGSGFGRFLTGAILFGASFIPGLQGWTIGTFGSGLGTINVATNLARIGGLLMISGAAEMLSPQPEIPEEVNNRLQNFSFSGIANVDLVGTPIPIVMGRAFCGSVIVSTGLDVDQVIE